MIVQLVAILIAAAAAVTDARTGRIPNMLSFCLVEVTLLSTLAPGGSGDFIGILVGAVVCGAVPVFLFCRGAMGGGDVKLLLAIGAALGAARGLEAQMIAYVAAALYSVVLLVRRGELARVLASAARVVAPAKGSAPAPGANPHTVRLGVFILVGCLLSIGRSGVGFP